MKVFLLRLAPVVALAGVLGACAAAQTHADNSVAAAETALTAAEQAATLYTSLPRCAPHGSPLCSQASVVASIKAADNTAYSAVVAARHNKAMLSLALQAIADLRAAVPANAKAGS